MRPTTNVGVRYFPRQDDDDDDIFILLSCESDGGGEGGISYTSLGRVVAGGLTVGTFLTLFFVPLLYILLDEMRNGAYKWMGWLIPSSQKAK